ncbi:carbohydrate ABC transporter permease [Mediterraneibacter sp. NSJ-55]|uniref:Carbohydrate ABC transporter permease n=1 Tax=Mediterraneibacter hominis TaxID=2763054 RepID=A0A923RRH9_9FIRM|nr:carbohydrate ABC transporter permease [Mediterraneibacter hominis]MBC5690601.1 carbohydrate ABC transporter permease [Mediterraneibacter hominis]
MRRRKIINVLLNLLVVAILIVTLFPFFIMLTTALKTDAASVAYPPELWPGEITFQHFQDIVNPMIFPFFRYLANSFLIAFITAVASVIICSLGGYSLAKLNFFGKRQIHNVTLVVYMFSGILLIVPLFQIFNSIGLIDNRFAVILACLVSSMPAALSMLVSYFQKIPDSIEEAARIDGLNRVQVIFKVVMPLSVPGIMSVFSYVFMQAWNNFLFANTFLSSMEKQTLIIGMRNLFTSQDYVWGRMMVASLLTAIPVIIVFSLVERFISGGRLDGGVKG